MKHYRISSSSSSSSSLRGRKIKRIRRGRMIQLYIVLMTAMLASTSSLSLSTGRRSTAFVTPSSFTTLTTTTISRKERDISKRREKRISSTILSASALPSIRTTELKRSKQQQEEKSITKRSEKKTTERRGGEERRSIPKDVPKLSDLLRQGKVQHGIQPFQSLPINDNNNHNDPSLNRLNDETNEKITTEKNDKQKTNKKPSTTNNKNTNTNSKKLKPWKASYNSSRRTQQTLQSIVVQSSASSSSSSPTAHAISLLSTLLEQIPSYYCNEVNLLYALSSTVKILSSSSSASFSFSSSSKEEEKRLEQLLTQAVQILSSILPQLNERQLCNASWILCKIYLYNSNILPLERDVMDTPNNQKTVYHGKKKDGAKEEERRRLISEVWDLSTSETNQDATVSLPSQEEEEEKVDEGMINMDKLLDDIAQHLLQKLLSSNDNSSNNNNKSSFQSCELSMALYSYAILRSKSKPTGWEYEPVTLILQNREKEEQKEDVNAMQALEYENLYQQDMGNVANKKEKKEEEKVQDGFYYETGLYDSYLLDTIVENEKEDDEYKTFMPETSATSSSSFENDAKHAPGTKLKEEKEQEKDDIQKILSTKDLTNQLFDAIARELLLLQSQKKQGKASFAKTSLALLQTCTWAELTNIAYAYAMRGRYQDNTFSGSLAHEVILEATHRIRGLLLPFSSSSTAAAAATDATNFHNTYHLSHHSHNHHHDHPPPLPRDVAELAWSIGVMQADNYHLGDAFLSFVDVIGDLYIGGSISSSSQNSRGTTKRPLQDWNCADLVQLSVSLAHGRIDDQRLLKELYGEVLHRLRQEEEQKEEENADANEQIKQMAGSKHRATKKDNNDDDDHHHRTKFHGWEISILLWVQASLYLTSKLEGGQIYNDFSNVSTKLLLNRIQTLEKEQEGKDNEEEEAVVKVGLGSQERANLAWSLTVLERYDTEESVELLRRIFSVSSAITTDNSNSLQQKQQQQEENKNAIQLEHAHQLYQAYTILQEDCPSAISTISPFFALFLKERWSVEKSRRKSSSARHLTISRTLDLMRVPHVNEHEEDIDVAIVLKGDCNWTNGGVGIDECVVVEHEGGDEVVQQQQQQQRQQQQLQNRKVAVEFDGPHHFTRVRPVTRPTVTTPRISPRVLGHTALKYRILKKKGWTVVRVPFYEFDKIPFWASMERQRYLQRLLKTHANIRFSDIDVSEYKAIVPNRKSRFD